MKGGYKEMRNTRSMGAERPSNNKRIVQILAGVIILLVLFIGYTYIFKPQMAKYDDSRRMEGAYMYIYDSILPQIQSNNGFVQVPVGNQTIVLAYVSPEQLQQMQQAQAQAQQAQQGQEQPAQPAQ